MKRQHLLLTVIFSLFLSLLIGCSGGKQEESDLLQLLHFIPDKRDYRFVTYGDAAAWHTSWNVPRIDDVDDLESLDDDEKGLWMSVMTRQTLPPNTLGAQYIMVDDMRSFYGFDIFNVDQYLYAGQPPDAITILQAPFDNEVIDEALTNFDYDDEELENGGTLYSNLDDYKMNLSSPVSVGRVGDLNRIVMLDRHLIIGKATGVVMDAVEAQSGARKSLADNPDFVAAATALEDPALIELGDLVGVIFMERGDFADRDTYIGLIADASILGQFDATPELPKYELVAFATYHGNGESSLILAVVLDEDEDATEVADILADRLSEYTSFVAQATLDEQWDYEMSMGIEAGGKPVAIVVMKVDDPPLSNGEGTRIRLPYVFSWGVLVFRGDLFFLVTD